MPVLAIGERTAATARSLGMAGVRGVVPASARGLVREVVEALEGPREPALSGSPAAG